MKRLFSLFCFTCWILCSLAQGHAPILMHIAGKPISLAEFEYAYNKNNNIEGAVEKKTIQEYLDMFINYKLKVAAAEAAKLDTLSSFQEEFRTYRDMLVTPSLIDTTFIDSVARSVYKEYVERVGKEDLLTTAHILLSLDQTASSAEKQKVSELADSIYQAILNGANFAEMAKQYSQDPASASKGGDLPTIARGMTLREFEEAAYSLQAGQMSRPILSPVGFHIIWVKERKSVETYEAIYPTLLESLKAQGIEEASTEHRIQQLMQDGRSREMVMDSLIQERVQKYPDLQHLIQEYYDGLLLFEISKKEVWDIATQDSKGLARQFKKHKKRYAWLSPHFKGYVISGKTKEAARQGEVLLKKGLPPGKEMTDFLKENINKDSILVVARGPYLVTKGVSSTIDHLAFGDKTQAIQHLRPGFTHTLVLGKILNKPQSYEDVKEKVIADHQQQLEKKWITTLRKRFKVEVDKSLFRTITSH